MYKHPDDHFTTKLKVFCGVLDAESLDIGHEWVEEDHIDHQKDLNCCDRWVEVDSYFPIRKHIIKDGLVDHESFYFSV